MQYDMKRRLRIIALFVAVAAALVLAGAVALAVNTGGEKTMTLRELMTEFYRQQKGVISDQLIYNIQHTVPNLMANYLDSEFGDLTHDDFLTVRDAIAATPCADGTHRRNWDYVAAIARFADAKYKIPNQTIGINNFRIRTQKLTPYIETPYIRSLFMAIDDHLLFCLYASYFATAARLGELTALEPSDVDLTQRVFRVDKSCSYNSGGGYKIVYTVKTHNSAQFLSFPSWLVEPLRRLMNDGYKFLFHNGCDEPIRGGRIRYQLKRYCRKAGLPEITTKGLRKTNANFLQYCAVPVTGIAWQLRHSSTKTTEKYYLDRRPRRDERVGAALESINLVFANDKVEAAHG